MSQCCIFAPFLCLPGCLLKAQLEKKVHLFLHTFMARGRMNEITLWSEVSATEGAQYILFFKTLVHVFEPNTLIIVPFAL